MRIRSVGSLIVYAMLTLAVVAVGCKHPAPAPPPAPAAAAPPPARPTVTLQATPQNIQRGQSVTLRWTSTNATSLNLTPGVGNVAAEGMTTVMPADSATYTITATGPGGSADASARITVTVPPPPPPPPVTRAPSIEDLFARDVRDAYFDYDKADVRADARTALTQTADFLKSYPQVRVTVEGHADERGSTEYNLALGDRRATAAKDFLVSLGVAADRMQTVSYGKERPFCTVSNEDCWQQNRRAHIIMAK
jgi:peptidoglycan-associated lipoprotein